jgi:hypothetical protein
MKQKIYSYKIHQYKPDTVCCPRPCNKLSRDNRVISRDRDHLPPMPVEQHKDRIILKHPTVDFFVVFIAASTSDCRELQSKCFSLEPPLYRGYLPLTPTLNRKRGSSCPQRRFSTAPGLYVEVSLSCFHALAPPAIQTTQNSASMASRGAKCGTWTESSWITRLVYL